MSVSGKTSGPYTGSNLEILGLIGLVLKVQEVEELEERILPEITRIMGGSACLFLKDARLLIECFQQYGFEKETSDKIEKLYKAKFESLSSQTGSEYILKLPSTAEELPGAVQSYVLRSNETVFGILGVNEEESLPETMPSMMEALIPILAGTIDQLLERISQRKQLSQLNTYLTVSSMLYQSLNLHELMEMVLYCCMEAVSAEAASVLVLDDDKEFFEFFQAEGPTKPILTAAGFSSDKGLAGAVLQSGCSEIINDVYQDSRFYSRVDKETGFTTRNMIVIPLLAGEEKIGVLEVINKADGGDFLEDDLMLLTSIADEIAFAVRNAKVFEYVVNTYCKQRQGLMSCKGCERPLGSWTPCVKYREREI